jgi:hypothetical protein
MTSSRAIDLALDLARMPAFAPSMSAAPLPADVLEVIRIAAESPETCRAAALATGEPEPVLVEAARFYLQQVLFREEADCYRVLGIRPGESHAAAKAHMRWLLRWLHPDRNGSWDAVYAKRIVKAWREVSKESAASGNSRSTAEASGSQVRVKPSTNGTKHRSDSVRLPWIARPYENVSGRSGNNSYSSFTARAIIKVVAILVAILLLLGLSAPSYSLRIINALW